MALVKIKTIDNFHVFDSKDVKYVIKYQGTSEKLKSSVKLRDCRFTFHSTETVLEIFDKIRLL